MIAYDKYTWTTHLFDIEGSMVREIMWRVGLNVVWATIVVAYHRYWSAFDMSLTAHTLVGLALGLLLVFRTNASYDRFWEGRKLWGSIINETRNITRTTRALISPDATDLTQRIGLWTIAFAYASKNSLRGTETLGPSSQLLPSDEVEAALNSAHPPSTVGKNMTLCLVEARDRGLISDYVMIAIDDNVRKLVDDIGGCERIRSTPLPFVYVVHLRRALIAYCFTLPMALVSFYGWWTILVTFMISYTFFGIEEIGVEIEDPFGDDANDLPLEVFCEIIDREVTCLLEMETQPRAIPR